MNTFKGYVTRWALTKGILEMELSECVGHTSIMVSRLDSVNYRYFHGEGKEWHRTLESAVAKAEQMRAAKLKSLEK